MDYCTRQTAEYTNPQLRSTNSCKMQVLKYFKPYKTNNIGYIYPTLIVNFFKKNYILRKPSMSQRHKETKNKITNKSKGLVSRINIDFNISRRIKCSATLSISRYRSCEIFNFFFFCWKPVKWYIFMITFINASLSNQAKYRKTSR